MLEAALIALLYFMVGKYHDKIPDLQAGFMLWSFSVSCANKFFVRSVSQAIISKLDRTNTSSLSIVSLYIRDFFVNYIFVIGGNKSIAQAFSAL